MIRHETDILQRDCILAVDDSPALSALLRQRYPDCQVRRANSFLSAISDLSSHAVRAVVARVDGAYPQLPGAVAGLREAAGKRSKVLLCCTPDAEPAVRDAAKSGEADDYLVWPLAGTELDRLLGFVKQAPAARPIKNGDALAELASVGQAVAHLDDEPYALLTRLADLVRLAMGCTCATVIADGSAASSGGTAADPVLSEPLKRDGKAIGQVTIGERSAPYSAGDIAKLRRYAALIADMLAAADRQRHWRRAAMIDDLSGLYNRRYVHAFVDDLLERARVERFRVTVLLFDIDDFKNYNDTYGHTAGDEIIRQIGGLFQAHCREHDVVTRYGGDEFCVVFWDADRPRVAGSTHPSDAISVLARFQEALKTHRCTAAGREISGRLTISGGLASFPWDASTTGELIDRADRALLRAKQAGKNRVFVFGDADAPDRSPVP
jgi:diguanylate cyclase (GGDEF)-like protein